VRLTNSFRSRWNIFHSAGKARDCARSTQGPYVWASIAAAVIGLALSVSAWLAVSARENGLAEAEMSSRGNSHALILQNGINEYLAKVGALRALFQTSDREFNRREFTAFSEFLLRDQTAILAVSWIPRIAGIDRAAHELAAVRDGLPGYRIKSMTADGSYAPPADVSEYFPVFYSSKESSGSPVYGLDNNDGGLRQHTLERARDHDQIASSPNFMLHSGDGDRNGFFVALPVYRLGLPHDTEKDRRSNLTGYVQGVFQIPVLIETILATTAIPGGLDLYFFAADSGDNVPPLYFHPSRLRKSAVNAEPRTALTAGPHWSKELSVGDVRWTFIATPIAGGPGTADHYGAWIVLTCGLLVTWVVVGYIWASGRRSLATLNFANDQLRAQNVRVDTALIELRMGDEREAILRREAEMKQEIQSFNVQLLESIKTFSAMIEGLANASEGLSTAAHQARENGETVAEASNRTAHKVAEVATGADQVSIVANEIAEKVRESAGIFKETAKNAEATNKTVEGLNSAVLQIDSVIGLIQEIADQTNLLALNATIEAARAGNAGRGFAVVATEVKALANQTSRAVQSVRSQISTIQQAGAASVDALQNIRRQILSVDNISDYVNGAVADHGVSVREIAASIRVTKQETEAVLMGAKALARATELSCKSATEVIDLAHNLNSEAKRICAQADSFSTTLQSA
jgi:methyl-accepting chemotaxis protein